MDTSFFRPNCFFNHYMSTLSPQSVRVPFDLDPTGRSLPDLTLYNGLDRKTGKQGDFTHNEPLFVEGGGVSLKTPLRIDTRC